MANEFAREKLIRKIKKDMNVYIKQKTQWIEFTYTIKFNCLVFVLSAAPWCWVIWRHFHDHLAAAMYAIVPAMLTFTLLLVIINAGIKLYLKIIKAQYRKQHAEEYLFLRQEGIDP
jgi:hypothetical protein